MVSSKIYWTISSSADWITTDFSSASGDITINANEEIISKSGTVTTVGSTDSVAIDGRSILSKEFRIDDNELTIDLDKLVPDNYLLNLKFMSQYGIIYCELNTRIVRNQ